MIAKHALLRGIRDRVNGEWPAVDAELERLMSRIKAAAMAVDFDALLEKMRECGYEGAEWDELVEAVQCARDWLEKRYPKEDGVDTSTITRVKFFS